MFTQTVLNQQSNVYVYYGLSNFYQNHRRYVKSRDDSQLNGNLKSLRVRTRSPTRGETCVRSQAAVLKLLNGSLYKIKDTSPRESWETLTSAESGHNVVLLTFSLLLFPFLLLRHRNPVRSASRTPTITTSP